MSKKSKIMSFLKGGKSGETVASTETPKEKTVAELQQEYGNLCARLGDNTYQTYLKQEEAKLLLDALRRVNQDGAVAQEREAKETAAKEAAKTEEKSNG